MNLAMTYATAAARLPTRAVCNAPFSFGSPVVGAGKQANREGQGTKIRHQGRGEDEGEKRSS